MLCEEFQGFVENSWFLYFAGITTLTYVCLKCVYNLYTHFVVYFQGSAVDYRRFGRWALVTGSTDGIGKGVARELAKMGISIVLVSRNPEKLRRVAREIESEFQVEVQCVAIDFNKADDVIEDMAPSVYDVISNAIRDLEIGILVNNVGMGSGRPKPFLEGFNAHEDKKNLSEGIKNIINCNAVSQVKVTQLVLPEMVKRGKGLIINISSASARFVLPLGALYSASKRFNDIFSRALSYEYEDKGIVVQSIQPGFVYTNLALSSVKLTRNLFIPDYKTYAAHALRTVGKEKMTHGYWLHAFQMWSAAWIPESLTMFNLRLLGKMMGVKKRNKHKVQDKDKKYE